MIFVPTSTVSEEVYLLEHGANIIKLFLRQKKKKDKGVYMTGSSNANAVKDRTATTLALRFMMVSAIWVHDSLEHV